MLRSGGGSPAGNQNAMTNLELGLLFAPTGSGGPGAQGGRCLVECKEERQAKRQATGVLTCGFASEWRLRQHRQGRRHLRRCPRRTRRLQE